MPRPRRRTGGAGGLGWLVFIGLAAAGVVFLAVRSLGGTSSGGLAPLAAQPVAATASRTGPTSAPTPQSRAASTPTAAPERPGVTETSRAGSQATSAATPRTPGQATSATKPLTPPATAATPATQTTSSAAQATQPARAVATPPAGATTQPAGAATPPVQAATPTTQPTGSAAPAVGPSSAGAGKRVALTFDAGADRGYAEDILDFLHQEHVSASFGITSNWAKSNPDLVRRMGAEGFLVINHTVDHRSFTGVSDKLGGLTPARRRQELEDADAVISPLLGHSTRPWYRLPYGDDDAHVASDLAATGYTRKVGWTVDSLGWRGLAAADIVSRCLKLAAPNAVYVLHVGRESQDGLALPRIVAGLREQGYAFATVEAL